MTSSPILNIYIEEEEEHILLIHKKISSIVYYTIGWTAGLGKENFIFQRYIDRAWLTSDKILNMLAQSIIRPLTTDDLFFPRSQFEKTLSYVTAESVNHLSLTGLINILINQILCVISMTTV